MLKCLKKPKPDFIISKPGKKEFNMLEIMKMIFVILLQRILTGIKWCFNFAIRIIDKIDDKLNDWLWGKYWI